MSSVTTLSSDQIAQYVLLGTVIGTCAPIFIRNVYYYRSTSKSKYIKILKAIMAFFMAFKSALFIVFSVP
jgi:H+/Cl- antiporter ClcA